MQTTLDDIRVRAEQLSSALQELLELTGLLPDDARAALTSSGGFTLEWALVRAGSIAALSADIAGQSEEKFLLASSTRLGNLRDHLIALTGGIQRLSSSLSNLKGWGGFDRVNAGATVYTKSGNAIQLRSNLDEVIALEDNALEPYLVLASAARPRGIGTFAAASRTLHEQAASATKLVDELEHRSSRIAEQMAALEDRENAIAAMVNESRRLVEEIEKGRKTAEENAQRVAVATASAEEVRSQASTLEAEVREYDDKFRSFQNLIENREAAITKGNTELSNLQNRLTGQEAKVNDLIAKASEMLGGATVAGLSTTYKGQYDEVNSQLDWARRGFYFSVFLLIVSVLVALNLTSIFGLLNGLPPLPPLAESTPTGTFAIQVLAALGARALMIMPALLLAGFAAKRHASLFRLREEYSHKYAMAASVHGFKQQAPTYEQQIAAAVFKELLANPATTMDIKAAEPASNGFVSRLIMPHVEAALDKMSAVKSDSKVP